MGAKGPKEELECKAVGAEKEYSVAEMTHACSQVTLTSVAWVRIFGLQSCYMPPLFWGVANTICGHNPVSFLTDCHLLVASQAHK